MKFNLAKFDWQIKSNDKVEATVEKLKKDGIEFSPAFLRLSATRGITDSATLREVTNQQPQLFHDPFLLHDMDRAVERIESAIENFETILIYGDYDADGITSTLILYEALEAVGANVHYYLPNRLTDGYGPNTERWKSLVDELGVQLFITVDNGVAGFDAVEAMNKLSIDTIITDHHEIQGELPNAFAVIHPKHPLGNYPFKELSGAGVALKIASALLGEIPTEAIELAAIGTVADMVEITDENRTIVLSGLNLMKDTIRTGLKLLLEGEKVDLKNVNTETIGFIIGPRLNAIGRLGDPSPALELLKTLERDEAVELLNLVNNKNQERKALTKQITDEIEQRIVQYDTLPNIIIEADSNWPAGVLGIAASRLVNDHQRPAIIFQYIEETNQYKGSSRSVSKINIFEELTKQKEYLTHFGGHSQAAGLTIDANNWESFKQSINQQFEDYTERLQEPEQLEIDLELGVNEITLDFIAEVNLLGPFGTGNPKPKFLVKDSLIKTFRTIGADNSHLKMTVTQDNRTDLQTIGFGKASQAVGLDTGSMVSIVGELDINEWNGHRMPQLMIEDFGLNGTQWLDYRASAIHKDLLNLSNALYVFSHDKIATYMASNQLENKTIALFNNLEHIDFTEFSQLVIMEPPIDIDDLAKLITSNSWGKIYLGSFVQNSKYMAGIPTREEFVSLYKVTFKLDKFSYKDEFKKISETLNLHPVKLKAMFLMFLEAKFVTIENGWLEFNKELKNSKIDLPKLKTFIQYKSEYDSEALLNYQPLDKIKDFFEGN